MSGGVDWEKARAERVAGLTLREIAARHGVSHVTVSKHLGSEGKKKGRNGKREKRVVNKTVNPVVNPPALTVPAKPGAPTIRSDDLVSRILEGIADGHSTMEVCRQAGISRQTLCNWMMADRQLLDKYARAKDLCADLFAEQIIEIADDTSRDWIVNSKGEKVVDREAVQRSGLRMDARKWYAARVAPRKYGDRPGTDANLGGQGAGRVIEVVFVEPDGRVASTRNSGSEQNVHSIRGD